MSFQNRTASKISDDSLSSRTQLGSGILWPKPKYNEIHLPACCRVNWIEPVPRSITTREKVIRRYNPRSRWQAARGLLVASSLAMTLSRALFADPIGWGSNLNGQLGIGSSSVRTTPVLAYTNGALAGKVVTAVAVGTTHSLALTSDGQVFACGNNLNRQIGDGSTTNHLTPTAVDRSGVLADKSVTAISTSVRHNLAITSDGRLVAWGANTRGQLGDGTTNTPSTPVAVDMSGALADKVVVAVAAGGSNCVALTSEGQVFSWGANSVGQLGDDTTTDRLTAVPVTTAGVLAGKSVIKIGAGLQHSVALTADGGLYAWGWNNTGQLGDGTTTNRLAPVAVKMEGVLAGKSVKEIAVGQYHNLVLTEDSQVFGWGLNVSGQLGDGSTATFQPMPVAVSAAGALSGKTIVGIAAGEFHSVALASDGLMYTWGNGQFGQLGDGTTAPTRLTPSAVPTGGLLNGKAALAVAAGGGTCLVIVGPISRGEVTPFLGGYQIRFSGLDGWPYTVQRSSDLTTWFPLTTNTAGPPGVLQYTDLDAPQGRAYYRTSSGR